MKTVDWLFKLIIFFLLKLVLIAILIHLFFFKFRIKRFLHFMYSLGQQLFKKHL